MVRLDVYPGDAACLVRYLRNPLKMLRIVVDAGDYRTAQNYIRPHTVDETQILKYRPEWDARILSMRLVVCQLDIEQEGVDERQNIFQCAALHESAGLDTVIDPGSLRRPEQSYGKLPLPKRLAAGECHSAPGRVIERLVFDHLVHDLIDRHIFTDPRESVAPGPDALKAGDALLTIEKVPSVLHGLCPGPAERQTPETGYALVGVIKQLRSDVL